VWAAGIETCLADFIGGLSASPPVWAAGIETPFIASDGTVYASPPVWAAGIETSHSSTFPVPPNVAARVGGGD